MSSSQHPSDLITIWSIQKYPVWKKLQREKKFCVKKFRDSTPDFLSAYHWMAQQMEQHQVTSKPLQAVLPLWGWYQHEGLHKRRPDLRASGYLPKGTLGVRFTLKLSRSRVLLSDFDLWHHVLMDGYIPTSLADAERYDHATAKTSWEIERKKREESWQRIFDLNWADRRRKIAYPFSEKSIQATFWELRIEDVTDVTPFKAR